ncbi:hypothetical protein [Desulforamulus putei]|uniref:hypothetical protein n=1 Tax=Desulforamulus putei TaxID=74701 RepID=UPI002FDDDFC8
MNNWKTKVLSTALALSVLVPAASYAADETTALKVFSQKGFAHHQRINSENRQSLDTKMLDLISKYTPDSLQDWKNALAEREQLMAKLKGKAPNHKQKTQLSDEVKAKVNAIRRDLKDGKITKEQAQEQLKALGLQNFKDKKKAAFENSLMGQFMQAVKDNDEAKIKELLPQLLQQLKDKNQELSARVSEAK